MRYSGSCTGLAAGVTRWRLAPVSGSLAGTSAARTAHIRTERSAAWNRPGSRVLMEALTWANIVTQPGWPRARWVRIRGINWTAGLDALLAAFRTADHDRPHLVPG